MLEMGMRAVRPWWLCGSLVLALFGVACEHARPTRARCSEDPDAAGCPQGQQCVWIHANNGLFCAVDCGAGGGCEAGQICKSGAASSCQTCPDIVDVCE
jgi:hypothetical protein